MGYSDTQKLPVVNGHYGSWLQAKLHDNGITGKERK